MTKQNKTLIGWMLAIVLVLAFSGVAFAQDTWQLCRVSPAEGGGFTWYCVPTEDPTVPTVEPTATFLPTVTLAPTDVPTVVPTATPVPTEVPTAVPTVAPTVAPTATPDHSAHEADLRWHAPGAHGDRPAHEHGDPVPQWVLDAGYDPVYSHDHGTPGENDAYWKHTGFKGWAGVFSDGQEWYWVAHLDVNPGGQGGRFHSYQVWIKDATGAVSHMSGWMDFGINPGGVPQTGSNKVVVCGTDSGVRPIIMVNAPAPCTATVFENWYGKGNGGWTPDMGFNIRANYRDGGDPLVPSTWQSINGGANNLTRRIEFAWYADRPPLQRGTFWADQFGRVAAGGENDPMCSSQLTVGARTYNIECALQVVQPTLQTIQFPGNSVQRTFPGGGVVQLPN